jgi:cytochrome c
VPGLVCSDSTTTSQPGWLESLQLVRPKKESSAHAGAADIAAGERLFRNQCLGCHSLDADDNRAGPTLHALFGREAGTLEGFDFSPAMSESGIEWSSDTLDAFLADPQAAVPGTRMVLWGLEEEPRRSLIAYLESLSE